MKKILIWSAAAILLLGLAGGACWWMMRPQIIVLGNGVQLKLLAVTYGKHHVLPKAKAGGRKLQNGGMLNTGEDSLCLWVEQIHKQNNWPNYQILAYDSAKTSCTSESMRTYAYFNNGNKQGDEIMGMAFEAFPRRDSKVYFHIQQWKAGHQEDAGTFVVHNPGPRSGFTRWAPDPMPDSQQDGDLQAALNKVGLTNSMYNFGGQAKTNDAMNQGVVLTFHIEQGGVLATNWQPIQIMTTDASGNHSQNRGIMTDIENDEVITRYQWGLWPSEPAWKMRVEMSRTSGYHDDEKWTAANIIGKPGDMNQIWNPSPNEKPVAETTLGDVKMQILPVVLLSQQDARNYGGQMEAMLHIHTEPYTEGMRMNIVKVTDDQDRPIETMSWGGGGSDYRYGLKKIKDAKSFNVTLAFHRSRFLEYTIAPPKK